MKISKILLCIIAVLVILVFWFYYKTPSFVTGEAEHLEKVIIISKPYNKSVRQEIIEEESEMQKIYYIIKDTTDFEVVKYPNHAESVQWDSCFSVCLEYDNGDKDEFFASEKEGGIVRFLNTKGNSGDRGYMSGSNEKLWGYVKNINFR